MVMDKQKAYKSLVKKGFIQSQGDHNFLRYFYNGKLCFSTKVSHGSDKELDDYLIKKMSVQCKLDKNDFLNLINCPLSAEGYLEKLISKGNIID